MKRIFYSVAIITLGSLMTSCGDPSTAKVVGEAKLEATTSESSEGALSNSYSVEFPSDKSTYTLMEGPVYGTCQGCENHLVVDGQYYQAAVNLIAVNRRLMELKKSLAQINGDEITVGSYIEAPLMIFSSQTNSTSTKTEDTIRLQIVSFQKQNQIRKTRTTYCSNRTSVDVEADRPILEANGTKTLTVEGHVLTITYSLKIYLEENTQLQSTYGC